MAIAALITGIVSLVLAIIGGAIGVNIVASIIFLAISIIGGIVGIILSAKTMKDIPEKKGMGIGGLVTSIIAIVYGVISLIACVACIACGTAAVNGISEGLEDSYNNMTEEERQRLDDEIDKAIDDAFDDIDFNETADD